jgi:elongation factor Tu
MNRPPDIEGVFQLFALQGTARLSPVFSGYRPLHRLHDNYLTSGQHEYPGADQLAPGEAASVLVWFITPDVYPGSLWAGREIDVLEGPTRIVGTLTVTKVLNQVLNGSPETYSPVWTEPPNLDSKGRRRAG